MSKIERKAALRLNEHGLLEGTLTVTYTGLEALSRRLEERGADATARKEFLENEVRSWVPVGIQVEQTKPPDWESSQETMQTEFSLAVSGWASGTSRRAFMPLGLFSASEKHLFEHSTRVHPIYFSYPTQYEDDITFQIPPRLQVGSLPAEQNRDLQALAYRISATYDNGILQVKRMVNFNTILLDVKYYATVQAFFQAVRTGDEQQVVLQAATGN